MHCLVGIYFLARDAGCSLSVFATHEIFVRQNFTGKQQPIVREGKNAPKKGVSLCFFTWVSLLSSFTLNGRVLESCHTIFVACVDWFFLLAVTEPFWAGVEGQRGSEYAWKLQPAPHIFSLSVYVQLVVVTPQTAGVHDWWVPPPPPHHIIPTSTQEKVSVIRLLEGKWFSFRLMRCAGSRKNDLLHSGSKKIRLPGPAVAARERDSCASSRPLVTCFDPQRKRS